MISCHLFSFSFLNRFHPQNSDRQDLNFLIEDNLHVLHQIARNSLESRTFVHSDAVAVVAGMQRTSKIIRHWHSIVNSLLRVIDFSRQRIANADSSNAPHDGITSVGARSEIVRVRIELADGISLGWS